MEASGAIKVAFQALIADIGAREQKSAGAGDWQFLVQVVEESEDKDGNE